MMSLCRVIVLLTTFALRTTGAPTVGTGTGCETSPAVVGGTGSMTFHFREGLNTSSDIFHAYVIRSGDTGTSDDKTNINIVAIVVPIVFILLAVATAAAIYIVISRRKKRRKFGSENEHPLDDIDHPQTSDLSDDNDATSTLVSDETVALLSDYTDTRWYFGDMSPEDEADLPHFKRRNKPGSFLIRKQRPYFILAVCGEDRENKRFRINEENGYKIVGTAESFDNLLKLVEYYRKHDIVIDGTPQATLGKPFEAEPKEDWYAGKLNRRTEKRLFRSTGNEPSSFLIRECITIPGHYTLAVYINGKTKRKHFLIRADENTFSFLDTQKTFKSLTELVHFYKTHDIVTTREGNFGRLRTPVRAQTTGCNFL